MRPAEYDLPVLIVGAGAAGTTLALELARRGTDFRWIDRLAQPSAHSRAVTVHARTLELLEAVDPRLVQRFLARGIASPGYVMHYVDAAGARQVVRPGLDFRQLPSRYPFLLLHPQNETEATVRGWIAEHYGRHPEWGVGCTRVIQEGAADGPVLATLATAGGGETTIRTRYLVACDGAQSGVRRTLGLTQDGSDYAGTVLQNLDVPLLDFPDDDRWVHYCMGPTHFLMVAALPGGVCRLLMSQPADRADADAAPESTFLGILRQHFDGVRLGTAIWHSRWASRVRLAHQYRVGNVFLAGDAAHVHSTAGGQGMNCCMQDAFDLGPKLAEVIAGRAGEALLDTYEAVRRPVGGQVIAAASALHDLFMAARSGGPEALRGLQASGALDALVARVSGIAYRDGA